MKSNHLNLGLALSVALPAFVLFAGCKENADSSANSPSVSKADTNAAMGDADNTQKNVRDRNDATLTPGDQGNSETDRNITQKIRKAFVIDQSGYSMTAKNVKIITANGKVTLRGPVNTAAEKTGIAAIAKNVAGEGNVDDQLEVKTNP